MGTSRFTGGRLLGFLSDVQSRGLDAALQSLNLGSLIGRGIEELFFGLAEYVCPTDGSVDSGTARDAYTEMVVDAVDAGIESLTNLTDGQVRLIFERFVANSIFDRLVNDIATGAIQFASSSQAAAQIQEEIRDFVRGAVHDAVAREADFGNLTATEARNMTDRVYEQSFSVLEALGREEEL